MESELTLSEDQARRIVYNDEEGWSPVEKHVIETNRWTITREGVFRRDDGTHWRTSWREGATEMQDNPPFESEGKVKFWRVEKREVTVEKWVSV